MPNMQRVKEFCAKITKSRRNICAFSNSKAGLKCKIDTFSLNSIDKIATKIMHTKSMFRQFERFYAPFLFYVSMDPVRFHFDWIFSQPYMVCCRHRFLMIIVSACNVATNAFKDSHTHARNTTYAHPHATRTFYCEKKKKSRQFHFHDSRIKIAGKTF